MKILLTFPANYTQTPFTYTLIKDYDLKINILRASIKYNTEGSLLIDIDGELNNIEEAIQFLKSSGITVEFLNTKIIRDEEKCMHCGACTSVCSSSALYIDKDTWLVNFDDKKCLGCELCIKACPKRAIYSYI